MPSQDPHNPTSTQQPDDSTPQIEDLQEWKVTEQEGAQVKGGLNPQPLPPGRSELHIS